MTAPVPRLAVATLNPGKLLEFQEALAELPFEIVSASQLGITEFPEESGANYEENALVKAGHVAVLSGLPTLADDSGLEVDALNGAPGVYTARFGGAGLSDGERMAHLLKQIRNVAAPQRTARFMACIVVATPAGAVRAFEGRSEGTVLEGPRGRGGFGYDPIFFSTELQKGFAEATLAEKRTVSHRGRALGAFKEWALSDEGAAVLLDTTRRSLEEN